MAATSYTILSFDVDKAMSGALCAVISDGYVGGSTISDNDEHFKGSGVIRQSSTDRYYIVLDSITYIFDYYGKPVSSSAYGYVLKLIVANISLEDVGSAITSPQTNTTTITDDGISTETDSSETTILVDSLTARDQFAAQALRGILSHIDHPSELSDSEMHHFTKIAYKWASNMMKEAADARATLKDEITEKEAEVAGVVKESLVTNTEKLLNNLILELSKTDFKQIKTIPPEHEGDDPTYENIYHKRVMISDQGLGGNAGKSFHVALDDQPINVQITYNDEIIKSWLRATTVTIGGIDYHLNVPNSL